MGKKRKNYKFRVSADEQNYTIEKQVKDKTKDEGYSWVAIRWFPSAETLAKALRDMEAQYLVRTGVAIVEAIERGNKLVESLIDAENKEFDLREW